MERRFKAAVFDLDGTLLDTSEGILASVQYVIEEMGLEQLDEKQLKTFIGPPIQNSFGRHYGLEGEEQKRAAAMFRERYRSEDLLKARPYDGIFDVFEALLEYGIQPAVATYKRQDYALTLLKYFGFDRYTKIIYGSDFEGKLTKSDIIEKALADAGIVNYPDAVMIGDTENDAIGAQRLGTQFTGVTYGFGFQSPEDVYQFPAVGAAATTKELKNLLIGGQI